MINIQEKGSSSGKVSAIRKAFICILGILFCLTLMAGCSSDDEETSANTTNTSEMTETSSDESNDNANDNQESVLKDEETTDYSESNPDV